MEAPTICKVIEEGATILVYYYEISNLSILSLKQSNLPAVELQTKKTANNVTKHRC